MQCLNFPTLPLLLDFRRVHFTKSCNVFLRFLLLLIQSTWRTEWLTTGRPSSDQAVSCPQSLCSDSLLTFHGCDATCGEHHLSLWPQLLAKNMRNLGTYISPFWVNTDSNNYYCAWNNRLVDSSASHHGHWRNYSACLVFLCIWSTPWYISLLWQDL